MTLPNVILFPQAMLPLYIFEPRYRKMLADSLETHRMFAVALQKPGRKRETPSTVAGLGLIRASVTNKDGTSNLVLQGIARVKLEQRTRARPYRVHGITILAPTQEKDVATDALMAKVVELVGERLKLGFELPFKALHELAPADLADGTSPEDSSVASQAFRDVLKHLTKVEDPEQLVDLVSATLLPSTAARQTILETPALDARLRYLIRFLIEEIARRNQEEVP